MQYSNFCFISLHSHQLYWIPMLSLPSILFLQPLFCKSYSVNFYLLVYIIELRFQGCFCKFTSTLYVWELMKYTNKGFLKRVYILLENNFDGDNIIFTVWHFSAFYWKAHLIILETKCHQIFWIPLSPGILWNLQNLLKFVHMFLVAEDVFSVETWLWLLLREANNQCVLYT